MISRIFVAIQAFKVQLEQWTYVTRQDNQWWIRGNMMQCRASKIQMDYWPFVTYLDYQWWINGYLMQCRASKIQMEQWHNGSATICSCCCSRTHLLFFDQKVIDIQYSKSMNTSCEDYASTHTHTNSKESQDPYQQKVLFLRLSIPYISI